ncbi:hypothetical protein [Bacillus cereus]|uniref:hypothetical protein n=1 Tax=Bacillus cereus TaxID=1396 RepID=UPI0013FE0DBC|nr:hypothetical protein [Bacillus cereus]
MKNLYRGNGVLTIVTISIWITWVVFVWNPITFLNYIQIIENPLTKSMMKLL